MRRAALVIAAAAVALVVATGVAWAATIACQEGARVCRGTDQADRINGTPTEDNAYARRGPDVVTTLGGEDTIQGGAGKDRVYGGEGDDGFVYGGETGTPRPPDDAPPPGPFSDRSDDAVLGGPGNDALFGGYGQGGTDQLLGGYGDDRLQTYQRGLINELDVKLTREVVDCGPGDDQVAYDQGVDVVFDNCEQRFPVPPGGTGPTAAEGFGGSLFR